MKILITGISGFVARHFVELLASTGIDHSVAGIFNTNSPSFNVDEYPGIKCSFHQVDMIDGDQIKEIIKEFQPSHILHLASQSSVAYSWKYPADCIKENITMFLNLVEHVRLLNINCRILSVGSAEEYGIINEAALPINENANLVPVSPYGISRLLQEKVVEIYSRNYGLDIIHTRSFNHIGPYQSEKFVISSFAKQIIQQLNDGQKNISISAGDIDVIRDFTDVRDVVKAYYLLLLNGKNGSIYNVCSGKGYVLRDIIKKLEIITHSHISCQINEKNIRPIENRKVIGNYDKIKNQTGWTPEIPMEKSLEDLLLYWKSQLVVTRPS